MRGIETLKFLLLAAVLLVQVQHVEECFIFVPRPAPAPTEAPAPAPSPNLDEIIELVREIRDILAARVNRRPPAP